MIGRAFLDAVFVTVLDDRRRDASPHRRRLRAGGQPGGGARRHPLAKHLPLRLVFALFQVLVAVSMLAVPPVAWSRTPALTGRVVDEASILPAADAARIAARLATFERETSHQIAVLTVRSLDGEAIESFSLGVARAWRLGRQSRDNGILIVVAPNERQVRIELGSGFATFIPDQQAREIIVQDMAPSFGRGAWAEGLERGLDRLMREARALVVRDR